jgi:multidrug resistance efflux pump
MQFESWAAVKIPPRLHSITRFATGLFVVFFIINVFMPWTQTISAQGKLSAYSPIERPQMIHAPLEGRIHHWHINEGMEVHQHDLLLELADVDARFLAPDLLPRLDESIKAVEEKRDAALARAHLLDQQITEMAQLIETTLNAAESRVQEAINRIRTVEQRLAAAKVSAKITKLNLQRSHVLEAEGLVSRRDLELAINADAAARAELNASEAALQEASQAQRALAHGRDQLDAELVQRLLRTRDQRAAALGEAANASKEIADLRLTRSNASQRRLISRITAPIDGTVVRMARIGTGEVVKPGEILITIVPSSAVRAVEMWVDPLDAPLLKPGRPVRLLFQGIPAIPLPAWPEFMAGTYDGRILVVDQESDELGRFRFWVVPDTDAHPWPPQTHVRQGTSAIGWVILNRVPFWYEMWRRVNLFPPDYVDTPVLETIKLPDLIIPKAGRPGK